MKWLFKLCLILFVFNATAQKGWQYDKLSGFKILDTTSILKDQQLSMAIKNGFEEVVAYYQFNENKKLVSFFNADTAYFVEYDSLFKVKKLTKVNGDFSSKHPNIFGDSITFITVDKDTNIVVKKSFFSGKSLAIHNDSLNKAYHRVKYDDQATGEVLIPLKKKLKTKFEQEKIYVVKIKTTTITKGKKGKITSVTKYPLKRTFFEKPSYMVSKKIADLEEANETNRLYHKRVIFDKKGNLVKFYFTDEPTNVYSIIENPDFQLEK